MNGKKSNTTQIHITIMLNDQHATIKHNKHWKIDIRRKAKTNVGNWKYGKIHKTMVKVRELLQARRVPMIKTMGKPLVMRE